MITKEQLFNGVVKYIDGEVIPVLSTSGKWAMGTFVVLLSSKYDNVMANIMSNDLVKMLGIVDSNGTIDIKTLLNALRDSADKYGTLQVNIPLVGTLGFKSNDVEKLGTYIGNY